jgi:hypothetical protein
VKRQPEHRGVKRRPQLAGSVWVGLLVVVYQLHQRVADPIVLFDIQRGHGAAREGERGEEQRQGARARHDVLPVGRLGSGLIWKI